MSKKTLTQKLKALRAETGKHWDTKKTPGMNMHSEVAKAAVERPAEAIEDILRFTNSTIAIANAGKAQTFEVHYQRPDINTEKGTIGNCQICGHPNLKHGSSIVCSVNGKPAHAGKQGVLIGRECEKHAVYILEEIKHKDFKMYEPDRRQRERARENTGKMTIELDQLPAPEVSTLREEGYDLNSEIGIEAVKAIRKQIAKGDFSGLEREIDPGKNKDMIRWAISKKRENDIYDSGVYDTVTLLEHNPKRVTKNMWAKFVLYYWQERKWAAKGELAGVKDDILYLEKLQKEDSSNTLIGSGINREQKVAPVKAFSKAQWEEVTIGDLLTRDSVTKAQSRALKHAAPYLQEKRERHNRELMNSYCKPEEFGKLLENLREKYHEEKGRFHEAKIKRIRRPDTLWAKADYKVLKKFFNNEEKTTAQNKISTREYAISFLTMPEAAGTDNISITEKVQAPVIRTLYVEGKKLELAKKLNDYSILKGEYMPVQEAAAVLKDKDFETKLDKLVNGAVELDDPPRTLKNKIAGMRISRRGFKTMIEDLRQAQEEGLIPTKYVQDSRGLLAKAIDITKDYEADDGSIAKDISWLKNLEKELEVSIENVNAETGYSTTRNKDPRLKTSTYEGKKYFTGTQKTAFKKFMNASYIPDELEKADIQKVKEAKEAVKKFYDDNVVFTNWQPDYVEFNKDKGKGMQGHAVKYPDVNWLLSEAKRIQEGTYYTRVTADIKKKMKVLLDERARKLFGRSVYAWQGEELEKTLNDPKTILSGQLAEAIENKYNAFIQHAKTVKQNRRELWSERIDIPQMLKRLEYLKSKKIGAMLPNKDYAYGTASIDRTIDDLNRDIVFDKDYVCKVANATKPAAIVIKENYHLYQNPKMKCFDFVAECKVENDPTGENTRRKLGRAFGTKHNNSKALMKYTGEEERDIGKIRAPPYTWYSTDRTRDYLDKICARAELESFKESDIPGRIYIRIIDAKEKL